jgi:cytoskeletal protein CcmA (bactofilin family)
MFNKWISDEEEIKTNGNGKKEHEKSELTKDVLKDVPKDVPVRPSETAVRSSSVNTILKGSKLTGDINVTCDMELSGDVEGNITSTQKSNIIIKGTCKGNIETKEGSVEIEGELHGGNITAGKDVKISGKFNGGEVKAAGKIYVDGEFNGKLEGSDIEIGSNASGKGEILYKEYISISRGAKVDVQISRTQAELKAVKNLPETKTSDTKPLVKENGDGK